MLYISLIIIAAFTKAIMDAVHSGMDIFKFSTFWQNTTVSFRRKWKNGDPRQGERFPGSSTVLVWFTDIWHFAQMIFLLAIFGFFLLPQLELNTTFWLLIIFLMLFESFYRLIKKNRNMTKSDSLTVGFTFAVIGYTGLFTNFMNANPIWDIFSVIGSSILLILLFMLVPAIFEKI